jgi:hypothetical protein
MPEEIIIDAYKFQEFEPFEDHAIRFKVTNIENRTVTKEDSSIVKEILNDLGKWESLIKGMLLFSELGIIQPKQSMFQDYKKPFGIELYREPDINVDNSHRNLWVFVYLTEKEELERRNAKQNPILQVEEIKDQVFNIQKWRSLKKTILMIKKEFC